MGKYNIQILIYGFVYLESINKNIVRKINKLLFKYIIYNNKMEFYKNVK